MIAINIALTVIVGSALALIIHQYPPATRTPMQMVGVCLLVLGFFLWTTARFQLGKSLAVTAQAKKLVTSGLYSKIRNPIYLFGSCTIIGLILTVGRPIWLLIFVGIIPLQIWRTRKESSVLESAFGDEYRNYRARTWF
jgi:protein-S-isoprenylcysteine O-methyltransferase Ste14